MAAIGSSRSSPFSRGSSSGFTLIELMVTLTVVGLIAGATLTITLSSQRIFETDQNRTTINQNLRSGMDLLGIDIRQAGERLPNNMPAIEIINGVDGAPDQLNLRRNLLDPVLPVCMDIKADSNADSVFVALKKDSVAKVPPGCAPVADSDGDGWPDNLQAWKAYREANGPEILAYIYNPTTRVGEFLRYDAEDNSTFHIHKANTEKWAHTYDADDEARVYILEELSFRLVDDVLQCFINGDDSAPLNLVNHLVDLQAFAYMRDGSVMPSLGPNDEWSDLRSIEITMTGQSSFANRTMYRNLQAHFFPRNVLSIADAAPADPTFIEEAGGGPGGTPGGKPGSPPGQAKKDK